ncbi:MAG: hypothetical protein ACT6S0_04695 [Roseateles sp.]|uniref:hypothetical protein n=1 Tax=Roseateles sp. TaxID=1971397 RepID=UPI004036CF23
MSGLRHNVADHEAMVHEHNRFTDTVGDAVIRIQDEAYKLGHARAKAEAGELRDLVVETLASFAVSFRDQGLRDRLQAAVDAARGAA